MSRFRIRRFLLAGGLIALALTVWSAVAQAGPTSTPTPMPTPTSTPSVTPTGTPTTTPGVTPTSAPTSLTLTVSVDTPAPILVDQTGIVVTIIADEDLAVGSTDITLNWDAAGIQVDSATSSVLSSFVTNIDNADRKVATASATSGSDIIPAGTALMTFVLTANELGVYNLFITDGDASAPDDLAGPVLPIPPVSIPYTAVDASLNVVVDPPTPTPTPMATPIRSQKVTMCHNGKHSISVSANAVPAHLAHGDTLETCP